MNNTKLIVSAIIAIVAIGLFVTASKDKVGTLGNEIVIGAPLSLSGNAAGDGESIKRGIDLAIEDLAKEGVKVRIAYEDDRTNPSETISAVKKLYATESHIDAFIGFTWGFLLDAAANTLIQSKTVVYSPANTSEIVNTKSSYIFFGSIKNAKKDVSTEEWLKSLGAKKTAIIVDNTAWGDSHLDAFKIGIEKSGSKLVMTERIAFGAEQTTMPSAFAKAKAAGADTILWTGYEDSAAAVLIQKIQQQGGGIKLLSASAIPVGLVKNKTVTIRKGDGIYYLRPQPSTVFSEKYKARYGVYPASYADAAYDGVMLIVNGLTKKPSDQSLADYLHSGAVYEGHQTDYTFDTSGDIKDGKWVAEKL